MPRFLFFWFLVGLWFYIFLESGFLVVPSSASSGSSFENTVPVLYFNENYFFLECHLQSIDLEIQIALVFSLND